ncbi:MAG: protein translocase subunit SecD [Calditrichaceae bacterium]
MKSKTTTKFIIILAALVIAVYLLYPTYKFSSMTQDQKDELELNDKTEFLNLKSKVINLGLDLQGGMHVVLEVDVKRLLSNLAKNKTEDFNRILDETEAEIEVSDRNFVDAFRDRLTDNGLNIARFYASTERRTESDVVSYLNDQTEEAVDRSLEILRNRVDEFGVSEPIIQKQGDRRIIVELAGVTDPTRVRELIGKTALLEFKLLKDNVVNKEVVEKIHNFILSKISPEDTLLAEEEESNKDTSVTALEDIFKVDSMESETAAITDTSSSIFEQNMFMLNPRDNETILVPADKQEKFKKVLETDEVKKILEDAGANGEFVWGAKMLGSGTDQYYQLYLVNKHIELSGETITDAMPRTGDPNDPNSIGKYEVSLTLNDDGARTFSRVTGANIGKRLAIILDNKVFLAPTLQVKIANGKARITGLDKMDEARDLAIVLKAGALPAPVKIIEERTVGPSLGIDPIKAGSLAAVLGLALVMLFMVLYYKLAGIVADLALILNIIFLMAVMAYFHATLTLPGIAGIILTIGMAVDANVLIFERIREEIDRGKTVYASVDTGYGKAFVTILDANVTTFIAGLVLYTYGSGPIQGFALTLMIGIVASMFTAIVVTRVIFDYSMEKMTIKKLSI